MASSAARPPLPPSETGADGDATITELDVDGEIPVELCGRLLGIGVGRVERVGGSGAGEGMVHALQLHEGRAVSYRSRTVVTDAVARRRGITTTPGPGAVGPDVVADAIVAFGGTILATGRSSLAYELTDDLDTLRRVDLAGRGRGLAAPPRLDATTGELYVLAGSEAGAQSLVVVSAGAFTRTTRAIEDAPTRLDDLTITSDHVVVVGDGFIGVTRRRVDAPFVWIEARRRAAQLVHADEAGSAVVVHAIAPALERWTLHTTSATADMTVLDGTPRRFACTSERSVDSALRFIWTISDESVDHHDLLDGTKVRHDFGADRPGGFVFVADPDRPHDLDGGWLIGFVHHRDAATAALVVFDAADLTRRAVATVRIPRRLPPTLRTTWIAAPREERPAP